MHSVDVFLPRSLDLHVMRWLEDLPPVPAISARLGRCGRGLAVCTNLLKPLL